MLKPEGAFDSGNIRERKAGRKLLPQSFRFRHDAVPIGLYRIIMSLLAIRADDIRLMVDFGYVSEEHGGFDLFLIEPILVLFII
jgi:hypothetical protein